MIQKRTRGYTWQQIRKRVLQANPLCVHCQQQGRVTLANEVDHIKSLEQGGTDSDDNLQGLCTECHLKKSIEERGFKYKKKITISIDGWPV